MCKEFACNVGDVGVAGLVPRSGRSPGGGPGNPLQYCCLENPRDRGAWPATVHGVAKSDTTESPNTHATVDQEETLGESAGHLRLWGQSQRFPQK